MSEPADSVQERAAPQDEQVATERSISPVAGGLGAGQMGRIATMAALLLGCGVLFAATWKSDRPQADLASAEPARQVVPFEPAQPQPDTPPTLAAPGLNPPRLTSDSQDAGDMRPPPETPGRSAVVDRQARTALEASARAEQLQTIRAAPLLAYSQAGRPTLPADVTGTLARDLAPSSPSPLDELRRSSGPGRALARQIGDRNFLILAGTSIPCVLQTALDSATPGYVSCIIPSDVYSDNGAVVLLEKGSKVLGEYRTVMRQGQGRLFVLWTRAVTPLGVSIALASPAADALGRAGIEGALDTHFWERFGGALLLSIVDQGGLVAATGSNPGQVNRLPSDAAAVALESSISIPPTLRKRQGAEVSIFVAEDFDFSAVYALRNR